jgi:predicted amidohydrolase
VADKFLKIATCQFAVSDSVKRNAKRICDFLRKAKKAKADIVHFSECALSGYVGTDFPNFAGYDWDLLREETEKIMALAGKLKLWIVLGSTHRLTEPNKPHNSLYRTSRTTACILSMLKERLLTATTKDSVPPAICGG